MNYADMTLKQLKGLASDRKIAGRSKATRKAQVIALLENWDFVESLEDDGLTGEYGVVEVTQEEIAAAKKANADTERQILRDTQAANAQRMQDELDAEIEADETVRRAAIAAANCVVEVTELGYCHRGLYQVYRGNPNGYPKHAIAKGSCYRVIRFYANDIMIDVNGLDILIHVDYVNIRFNSSDLSAA